jgi:hypothetical protein
VDDVVVADDVGGLERGLPDVGVERLRDADVARGGADAGVVERGAELGGRAADEAGVLDPGVSDLRELGEARLEVDAELVAQGVQLHADLVAGNPVEGAVAAPGGGDPGDGESGGGPGGCGGAEELAAVQ